MVHLNGYFLSCLMRFQQSEDAFTKSINQDEITQIENHSNCYFTIGVYNSSKPEIFFVWTYLREGTNISIVFEIIFKFHLRKM